MNWLALAKLAADLAYKYVSEKVKRQKAADKWAATPSTIKGCPRCKEIAFTPGQIACSKCGALL